MLVCHYYPAELMHIIINYLSKCASANTMCICHLLKFLPSRFQESYLWLFFNHLWFQRELFISSSHYLSTLLESISASSMHPRASQAVFDYFFFGKLRFFALLSRPTKCHTKCLTEVHYIDQVLDPVSQLFQTLSTTINW